MHQLIIRSSFVSVIICWFSLLTVACNSSSKSERPTVVRDDNKRNMADSTIITLPEIPSFFSIKTIKYSQIYSNVRYIALESNMYSTIGDINKIEITKEKNFLIFDSNNKNIVLFDSLGNYLNNIGSRGRGHAEYIYPIDVTYDKYYDQVIVFDNPGYLYYYKMDGTFVTKQKVPWHLGSICVLNKDTLAIDNNFTDPINAEGLGYNYHIFLRNGKSIFTFQPYDKSKLYSCHYTYQTFSKDKSDWFVHGLNDSIIYKITTKGMTLSYKFLIRGQEKLTEKQIKIVSDHMKEESFNQPKVIKQFIKSNNFIFAVISGINLSFCVYDILSNECAIYNSIVNDFGGPEKFADMAINNDEVFTSYDPSVFEYYCNSNSINENLRNEFLQYSTKDNPIIQICTLKK